jgi:hypothetical protein
MIRIRPSGRLFNAPEDTSWPTAEIASRVHGQMRTIRRIGIAHFNADQIRTALGKRNFA